jgi:thiol-disulfide isomerase/thioredoxin
VSERPAFTHRRERHGLVGPFSGRQLGLGAAAVVIAVLILIGITTPLGSTGNAGLPDPKATAVVFGSAVPQLGIGSKAPEFSGTLPDGSTYQLMDLDGKPISLADLRGKGVWVNFWASWCPPCQQETPILREVSDTYRDRGVVLVAVQVQQTVDDGRRYRDTYGLRYTIGADLSGNVFHAYHVFALPTQFFISADGVIQSVVQGPLTREGAIARVERIVPGGSAAPSPSPRPSPSARAFPYPTP